MNRYILFQDKQGGAIFAIRSNDLPGVNLITNYGAVEVGRLSTELEYDELIDGITLGSHKHRMMGDSLRHIEDIIKRLKKEGAL